MTIRYKKGMFKEICIQDVKAPEDRKRAMGAWPHKDFRPGQKRLYLDIIDKIDKEGMSTVLAEAPTASGKSAIAYALCEYYGSGYILTPQKVLQQQYEDTHDFGDLEVLQGRSNFYCNIRQGSKCSDCTSEGSCREECPYISHRKKAYSTHITSSNYSYFIAVGKLSCDDHQTRPVIILDECHDIESIIIDTVSVTLKKKALEKDLDTEMSWWPEDWKGSGDELLDMLIEAYTNQVVLPLKRLEAEYEKAPGMEAARDEYADLRSCHESTLSQILRLRDSNDRIGGTSIVYSVSHDDKEEGKAITIKPISPAKIFRSCISSMGVRVVMLSATPQDKDDLEVRLGIDLKRLGLVKAKSNIPPCQRHIYRVTTSPSMSGLHTMSEELSDKKYALHANLIRAILLIHPRDRGIIHGVSEGLCSRIYDTINDPRLVYPLPDKDKPEMLRSVAVEEFKKGSFADNAVLISPSISNGVSFDNDMARFAIIAKCPWGNLRDPYISHYCTTDPRWYHRQAMAEIVQMAGRVCRGVTDRGETYIIDSSAFGHLHLLPDYISEAVNCRDVRDV